MVAAFFVSVFVLVFVFVSIYLNPLKEKQKKKRRRITNAQFIYICLFDSVFPTFLQQADNLCLIHLSAMSRSLEVVRK